MLTFKVGDKAVYPVHGVGEVLSIEEQEIGGCCHTFYVLQILDNGMKIMVPTGNVETVGLREVIDNGQVDEVYRILREKEIAVEAATWNRRYREYMDKIRTGSVFEIAEVLRDLCLLKQEKELSFGERKMIDTARSLLLKELAIAKGVDEGEVQNDLDLIFSPQVGRA
jgi:CarD family transcriptional regulator